MCRRHKENERKWGRQNVPNREAPEHRAAAIEGAHGALGSCKLKKRNARRVMRLSEQPRFCNWTACLLEEGVQLLTVDLWRTEAADGVRANDDEVYGAYASATMRAHCLVSAATARVNRRTGAVAHTRAHFLRLQLGIR